MVLTETNGTKLGLRGLELSFEAKLGVHFRKVDRIELSPRQARKIAAALLMAADKAGESIPVCKAELTTPERTIINLRKHEKRNETANKEPRKTY